MSNGTDIWSIDKSGGTHGEEEKHYVRMNWHERVQHHLTWSTFVVLAVTGFMVEFPEGWVAVFGPYRDAVFWWRGLLHRIAAVVMMANMLYQVDYITLTTEGGKFFWAMVPRLQDLRDFRDNMAYYLGRREAPPRFDRFNYKEKMEYWSGLIGSFIITVTGLFLWFQEYFPKFIFDVSVLVHTMEAILASCAVMVWHFYEVHLKPGKFPMSRVWLDGKISEEELKEEHPLEYERMVQG